MSRAIIFGLCFCSLFLGSCTKKKVEVEPASSEVVNLAIWGNYLSPEMTEMFEKKSGLKLRTTNYSSNEELLAKIQSGAAGIDVAVPSDYMVGILIKMGRLEPLDAKLLEAKAGLLPEVLRQPYDSENAFSLPYAWGTAGIAINRNLYKEPVTSWKDIFENPKVAGRLALLDDVRETLAAALKMHGFSVNTTNDAEIEKAKKTLLDVKERVKIFSSDSYELLKNKEVAVAHAYATDALRAAALPGYNIEYVFPKEGATRSMDNVVILKSSKSKASAYKLINFLLSPEANREFVMHIWSCPVVAKVAKELPDNYRNSKGLFPSKEVLSRLEYLVDLGDKTKTYEDVWTAVKMH